MTTVTGTLVLPDATPDRGVVAFRSYVTAPHDQDVVTTAPVLGVLDDLGAFSVEVIDSEDPSWDLADDALMPYQVSIATQGERSSFLTYITGSAIDLVDLLPIETEPDVILVPTPGPPGPEGPKGDTGDANAPHIGDDEPTDPAIVEWFDTSEESVRGVLNSGDTMTGPLILSGDAVDPLGAATRQQTVGVVGNLLTDNQASIETDATGWAVTSGSCTISQVPGGTHDDNALQVVSTGAQSSAMVQQANPANTSIIPGNPYTFTFTISGDGPARSAYVNVLWRTETGSYISSTSLSSDGVTTGPDAATFQGTTALPPENARRASIQISVAGALSGETFLVDRVGMWMGAGGQWNMPGTPITGMGTRITRPNVDDRLIEQYNTAANSGAGGWSVVDYESGWRDISADLGSATLDEGGSLQMARHGSTIAIRVGLGLLPDGAGLGNIIYSPPNGWRPSGQTIMTTGRLRADSNLLQDVGIVDGFGIYVPSVPAGSILFSLYYSTDDPIPTSLPGTLVIPAPQ